MPSALIPFCSFGDNVGEIIIEDFNFPVCTMFQPTILDGQQCYEQKYDLLGGPGDHQGFSLVIDINFERSVHFNTIRNQIASKAHMKNIKENFYNKKVATFGNGWKLHIDTLYSYYGFNPGSYFMTAVKNISASGYCI